jgi:hypothetical protein
VPGLGNRTLTSFSRLLPRTVTRRVVSVLGTRFVEAE